jgi:pimeloyl-ACP methyl ester carboxylesterase
LQCRGFNGDGTLDQSIEQMAEGFAEVVCGMGDERETVICGYSWGGFVAFELAKKLEAMGRKIKLVIVDTAIDHKAIQHPAQRASALSTHWNEVYEKWRGEYDEAHLNRIKELYFNNYELIFAYNPAGNVEGTFVTVEAVSNPQQTRMERWAALCSGEFEQLFVPGDHSQIFEEANRAVVAEKILSMAVHPPEQGEEYADNQSVLRPAPTEEQNGAPLYQASYPQSHS